MRNCVLATSSYVTSSMCWLRPARPSLLSLQRPLVCADSWSSSFPNKLSFLSEHYAKYFKVDINSSPDQPEYTFDWAGLRAVHKSFLDSIIVELCLPQSEIPQQILYQILHDAMEESPRDSRRFPQAVWDAIGDLSVSSQIR